MKRYLKFLFKKSFQKKYEYARKRILACALVLTLMFSLSACTYDSSAYVEGTTGKSWDYESVAHDNFTDLGNYVIELPDYEDASVLELGLEVTNEKYDNGDISQTACTAMITTNDSGEVIVGRNLDMEISQYPAFVCKTTFGRYKTFGTTYTANGIGTYEEIQQMDALPDTYMALIPYVANDVLNEKGLYIESNIRTSYSNLSNYGLHSANGETERDDGTPWSELRACTLTLPQLVAQNCATVDEALSFIKNSYDWYTFSLVDEISCNERDMAFVIGDASGNYGVIEIAQDTVSWLPYQNGQANYYLTPQWDVLDYIGSGYGRLAGVEQVLEGVQTLEEAMDAMKPIMWRNEMLWVGESYKVDSSTNLNLHNQVVFQDDQGNSQLDWRSDYCDEWPVLDDGRLLLDSSVYENAKKSTYDTNIAKYIDDAIAVGTLVVDDGSILFEVNDEKLTLDELREKYERYCELSIDDSEEETLRPYYETYNHLLSNQTTYWCQDDQNFEALKACAYERLHTRYDEEGNYDPNSMSIYEKLKAYYGYDTEKNETYLRDDGEIWTTGLNIGVNCAQKQMKIRFWENDNLVYSFAW